MKYKAILIAITFLLLLKIANAQIVRYVYLFVPNSEGYNSISEINITDPSNPKEVSRHYTVPYGYYGNPSRTAIDHYGNAWIGNRDTNSLVKVGNLGKGTCVDRNRNGVIDTARDTNDNGIIDDIEMVRFEEDECILEEVLLPIGSYQIDRIGCAGCHCSGARIGTIDLTAILREADSYTFAVWCTEAAGDEICKFRFKIEMPDESVNYIETNGDYGNIEVYAYKSGIYSDCNSNFQTIISRANTPFNNWYSEDHWPSCNYCDFYVRIEVRVKRVDWSRIMLEVYGDDSFNLYSNKTILMQIGGANGVRAVCVDANDNVYAGLYGYRKLFYVSRDGEILKGIDLINCNPYGCMVDKNGYVWISCISNNGVAKYDPGTDRVDFYHQGIPVYTITPTVAGDGIVFSGWTSSIVRKIGLDGSTIWSVSGPYTGRGITVDREDNIYVVGSNYGEVWKYNKNGNIIKQISGVCGNPIGIGLDYYDNVWVACYDGQLVRLNKNLDVLNRVTIGNKHYVYSDWTGYVLQEIVAPLPEYPIIVPPAEFLNIIPMLLGNPLFFILVFGLAVAAKIESMLRANGYAFIITFLGIIITYALFGGIINWWVILILIVLIIGGVMFFRKK